ncbi:protein STICHEL-like 2 isoform X1 [Silene latifolia]|uniref:protein STICHEL-like 2 isoform X1 n=1 Tax=Silene latifolia TaxID=37657 RepID=UPI003D788BAD
MDPSFSDPNESRLSVRIANSKAADVDCCNTSSPDERSKHRVTYDCEMPPLFFSAFSLSEFQWACLYGITDLAVVELEFQHPDYASKAEKSWNLIASSLQSVLRCNVEIRINLTAGSAKPKRTSFSLRLMN